jgi:pSer/pThr/pTyr-binding forkhead associated (FHA) protein
MVAQEPAVHRDAPTEETLALPRLASRDRRRAAAEIRRPAPGRYLAVDDAGDVVLVALREAALRLGRDPAADMVFDDPSVSRRHAIVLRRDGGTVILDDRSLNGVRVNGKRVMAQTLRDGDVITLGAVSMRYVEVTT